MKRILTIQDISCLGKCSLTVALPVISALGIETVILPTAVLSTHTMFKGFTVKDLSDQIAPITAHWKKEHITFDAIYTGYIGTAEQIDMVKEVFCSFLDKDTVIFIDPVMADNGKLYPAFDMAYVDKNRELCQLADIIVPNITEAALMTDMEYRDEHDKEYIRTMLRRLADLGAQLSILTGVSLEPGKLGVVGYDRKSKKCYSFQHERIGATYHGTGDLFSSSLIGEIIKGKSWEDAIRIAATYTAHTVAVTLENPEKPWYGVDFEKTLPELIRAE